MVLEKTVAPCDIEKVVIDTFGEDRVSLVVANDAIVLTRASARAPLSDTALLSESALARDWLLPEEDEAWAFL